MHQTSLLRNYLPVWRPCPCGQNSEAEAFQVVHWYNESSQDFFEAVNQPLRLSKQTYPVILCLGAQHDAFRLVSAILMLFSHDRIYAAEIAQT